VLPFPAVDYRQTPKPAWVREEIVRLKAQHPDAGCRLIAHTFNRQYAARGTKVGKSFVHAVIQKHHYEIEVLRRRLKHHKPRPVPRNLIWAIDLTGKHDAGGEAHSILGILDHGTRLNLTLEALVDKSTVSLLRHLLDAIERFGRPKVLRTDNEAIFTSRPFRLAMMLLGIRHQRTEPAHPWQNGRIERFFGTLKSKLDRWQVDSREQLQAALQQFRFWYNHVRPHDHLEGRTPAEAWSVIDPYARPPTQQIEFDAWDGLLQGVLLRH
jgi:transposase InsO family protein